MLRVLPGIFLVLSLACCGDGELPRMLVIRPFSLVDQASEPFDSRRLAGHVWVASFVFTSCRDVCPLITNQMANLGRRLPDPRLRFVSISVDPEVDTPERLAGYASRYRADERWSFLTGERAEVRRVVTRIFRVPMGERSGGGGAYGISHFERLLLIDRELTLRGAYETDRAGMDRLVADIEGLLGG